MLTIYSYLSAQFGKPDYKLKKSTNMKKLFLAAVLSVFAASGFAQSAGYKIDVKVSDASLDGKEIYLLHEANCLDTVKVENAAFSFASDKNLENPLILTMRYGRMSTNVLVDNGAVVTVTLGDETVWADNGGINEKMMNVVNSINAQAAEMRGGYNALMQQGASKDSIQSYLAAAQNEINASIENAIDENKDNILGAYMLSMTASNYSSVEALNAKVAEVKYASTISSIKAEIAALEKVAQTSAGKMFVDFDGKNLDGTVAHLSDYVGKGKYVLVDFWASWCGPCRREIPNLVELQNAYGGDKFVVLGVNVWDKESEFRKALESEGINYPQLYASDDTEATQFYGIKGIPQIILFAPDGTIVARDLRGDAMKKLVAEKMGE